MKVKNLAIFSVRKGMMFLIYCLMKTSALTTTYRKISLKKENQPFLRLAFFT
jgi:hypothetical protein